MDLNNSRDFCVADLSYLREWVWRSPFLSCNTTFWWCHLTLWQDELTQSKTIVWHCISGLQTGVLPSSWPVTWLAFFCPHSGLISWETAEPGPVAHLPSFGASMALLQHSLLSLTLNPSSPSGYIVSRAKKASGLAAGASEHFICLKQRCDMKHNG